MTLQLLLQRHAKSSRDDQNLDDHSRPLSYRGQQAAIKMADVLLDKGLKPDLILCSTAERARRTADPVLDHLSDVLIEYKSELYIASVEKVIELLRQCKSPHRILVIGHNPTMEDMAACVLDPDLDNDLVSLNALRLKYPTGALAAFTLSCASWHDFAPACGQLTAFYKPRDMDA